MNAINFNGTGSFTPNIQPPAYGNTFTLEMWIKPNAETQKNFSSFIMRGTGTSANGLMINNQILNWRSNQSGGNGQVMENFNATNFPIGQWTHIALVVNNNQFTYYRNGNQISTGTISATGTNATNITIGDWSVGYNSQFNGAISNLRLWNVARNVNDINQYKNRIISNNTPNLVNQYILGDDSEGIINGTVDYTTAEYVIEEKILFSINSVYHYYSEVDSQFKPLGSNITEETYKNLGILDTGVITEETWNTLSGIVELLYYTNDTNRVEVQYSIETTPFTLTNELGSTFSVIEYTDNPTQDSSIVQAETEPFSVYDHISETPEVLVYTELTDDIKLETTTEPFDVYDEFGNEVEVLHYTDDVSVNGANLVLEANWSPIDELDGDLEVVTWTNEENAFRKLEVEGELSPKLIYPTTTNAIIGDVANIKVALQNSNGSERFVLTDNNSTWYVWNGTTFVTIPKEEVSLRGMTLEELNTSDFSKWTRSKIAVGVFADSTTEITNVSYDESIRNKTSKVNDISLYVLNTTAKIDIQLIGSTVRGTLSDADSTKVQYRVVLNDSYYYPSNGNFTALTPSPVPIEFTLKSTDVKVGDWNKLKVEFKDYFGTTDYWEVEFIGRYSGVMFRTIDGQYYSSDIGEVLRYLDFGSIVSGQTTMIQTVVLKNEFGYSISDVDLSVNTNALPKGVNVEFSRNGINQWSPTLRIADSMAMDEEVRFDVRMRTVITATPTPNGKFDIFVMAKKE